MVAFASVAGAAACGSSSSSGGSRSIPVVRVVAAENFWGDITRQVGGVHVDVSSIITDPSADPHQYESDARDAASVADAEIVIRNGLGYDDFMSKLLSSTSKRGRIVVSVQDVLHASADANPHLWYDVPRVPDVARAIESALATADPNDGAVFTRNRTAFVASLAPLERTLAATKAKYPRVPVAYTERVPEYLVAAAGLTDATPRGFAQAVEDGNEPSPGDGQKMDDLVTQHRIRVLLYNAQATSPVTDHLRDLAQRSGVPVVAVTETLPRSETSYQSWQQHQLDALLRALGG